MPGISRSMVGGFWMIDANRKASIYLRNGLEESAITVTPNLFLSNGTRIRLGPVTLEPSGTSVLSINDLLQKQGIAPWATLSGYVEIEYAWAWDPLCVTVTSTDPVHSLIFTTALQPSVVEGSRVHLSKAEVDGMYAVDGMWWKPEAGVSGFVALSNSNAEPVDARVQMSDDRDNLLNEYRTHISPHGTKIVALEALNRMQVGAAGGLRILHGGAMEGLIISAGLEDASTGYSAAIPFHYTFNIATRQNGPEEYAELGLMTGAADPMMRFPADTVFAPFSVLRNVSDEPMSVTPSLYWMEGGKAKSSNLQPILLAPFQTRALDTSLLLRDAGLSTFAGSLNLTLSAQGKPHSLLLASGSVDRKNTYVFQVLPHGVVESNAKTISYWSTGNGDDTMITVWNPADEAQDFLLTLFFAGGHYRFPVHLEARATRTLNISEIIAAQVADDQGNIVPPNITEGSAKISGVNAENEEILVAVDSGTYNVRKATCSYYCISCDGAVAAFIGIAPFSVVKGKTDQLNFMLKQNTGSEYYGSGTWSSSKTTVATVGGSNGLVTGVSPGTMTISAYNDFIDIYDSEYCSYDPNCPVEGYENASGTGTVASLSCSPSSVTRGSSVTCTASGASGSTFSNWQFSDGTNTVNGSGTSSTWSGTMVTSGTVSVTVTSNGQGATASAQITTNARTNFAFAAVTASLESNGFSGDGCTISVPSPPAQSGDAVGKFCLARNFKVNTGAISDNGPNNGYSYVTSISNANGSATTAYFYVISPDLQNTFSTFYKAQCGNYNSQTNPNGYISGSNLLTDTTRHESGSVQSHYENYVVAQNSATNNLGTAAEAKTGLETAQTLANSVTSTLNQNVQNIISATQVEPCSVQQDASCNFQGYINFAPYASCN